MGGMTGMWLAVNAPERIDRLALCSTSTHMPPAEQWHERAATVREQGMGAMADGSIERWFSPQGPAERPDAVERVRQGLLDTPAEGYAASCEAIAAHDLREQVARHHGAHAGHRRRPGPVHAARPRPLHRRAGRRARGWSSSSAPATC